ncbi:MAG: hypothetical protein IPM38_07140 [Ignavibacteria bacterium]|nr:hypothetical protein [Ignavibacteria bacterium]
MEIELREILTSIDSKFSGPASCRLNHMITGKLEYDYEEVVNYLLHLKKSGNIYGNGNTKEIQKDAADFLSQLRLYARNKSNKNS